MKTRTKPSHAARSGQKGALMGQNLIDPNRADKLLRRFSWQAPLPDAEPKQEIDQ